MSDLQALGIVFGLLISAAGLFFNAYKTRSLTKQLRHSASVAVYNISFEWDKLLVKKPSYYEIIEDPSDGELTKQERALAEYRLDIIEFVWRQRSMDLYGPESESIRKSINSPLIRKALKHDSIKRSTRNDFYEECVDIIEDEL